MILTISSESTPDLSDLRTQLKKYGIKHKNLKIKTPKQDLPTSDPQLRMDLLILFEQLYSSTEKVYAHCTGNNLERTGLCIYTLFRWSGFES